MGKVVQAGDSALRLEAPAQAALAQLSASAVIALKVARVGGKVDRADVDFPLPGASEVMQPEKGVLNKWYAGPVALSEVDTRTKHVQGCPLASYM